MLKKLLNFYTSKKKIKNFYTLKKKKLKIFLYHVRQKRLQTKGKQPSLLYGAIIWTYDGVLLANPASESFSLVGLSLFVPLSQRESQ